MVETFHKSEYIHNMLTRVWRKENNEISWDKMCGEKNHFLQVNQSVVLTLERVC